MSGTPPALRRIVLWVPDWPVVAAVLDDAADPLEPVAVHDQRGIVVASDAARRAGVRTGMRRRVAQSRCPELKLLPMDPVREARAFELVVRAAETIAARSEVLRPGLLVMPAAGSARYFGSEGAVAEALVGAAAQEADVESQVGVADGLLAAVLAAREGVVVSPGGAAEYLAAQDVSALGYGAATRRAAAEMGELADLLHRLGLHRLGDLAALTRGDVAARLGTLGLRAQHLARGGDERPPASARPVGEVTVHAALDPPAERADRAAFAARSLAEQLSEHLLRAGQSCARLEVCATTQDGAELARSWLLDAGATASEMTDRVRWQLDGWLAGRSGQPPAAPLTRLELVAHEVGPAGVMQDGLWGRARRGQLQAERAVLRVQGLVGEQGVLVPVAQGGRDPRGRARLAVWGDEAVPLRPAHAPWPGSLPEPWPATVPAQPVPVEVLDAAGGRVVVDGRAALSAPPVLLCFAGESPDGLVVEAGWGRTPQERRGGVKEAAELEGEDQKTKVQERNAVGEETGRERTRRGETKRGELVAAWAGPWPITERWWDVDGRRGAYLQVVPRQGPALLLVVRRGRWFVEGVYD